MTKEFDIDLDDFQAGFIAGWLRCAGILETPTIEQLAAAMEGLRAFETEAQKDGDPAPNAAPTFN
jgi:hypothetical protein